MSRNKDRRISSASQVSTISTSSSSCTSYGGGSVSSAPPHQTNHTSDQRICELKKFCVDPQVTSFDVLRDLIAHAFAIKSYVINIWLNMININMTPLDICVFLFYIRIYWIYYDDDLNYDFCKLTVFLNDYKESFDWATWTDRMITSKKWANRRRDHRVTSHCKRIGTWTRPSRPRLSPISASTSSC